MAGKEGNYSNIVIYDERKRYYYFVPQKNKPLLDDEIRNMGIGLLDQTRRAVQHVYGDVAAPHSEYSGFYSTADAFKVVESSTDTSRNFTVRGGNSLDHPAVLYAKGFYIFLTGDIDYKTQQYSSESVDLSTASDKTKTITAIPAISTPTKDRIDIVYVDLHFEEVSSVTGSDSDVYLDSGNKNPVVGTDTGNRLRAVIDIRVHEDWSSTIDQGIFIDGEFLGAVNSNDSEPTDNHYKIPIAAIYREAYQDTISNSQIVDLLSLYNKRVHTLEELTYRTRHGGYTETGVWELGLSGFQPQFQNAKVDEGAFAAGLNKGLGTEAFNTNSVTPRVLDNTGKFFIDSLMVGHDTGLVTLETGPENLGEGEVIVKDLSARSIYVGYGETGVTGMREYHDNLSVVIRGVTGKSAVAIQNIEGETGSETIFAGAVQDGRVENFLSMDYRGRVGFNTQIPGWSGPEDIWNVERYNDGLFGETGVNINVDVNGSARVADHAFIDKDSYVGRDSFGKTWKIPKIVSNDTPALFGFTGIPQEHGITGSLSSAMFKRGIGVMGDPGVTGYGYTGIGTSGFYEAYDSDGKRIFTIGDLGYDYDRVLKSLYGVGLRKAFLSNISLLHLPTWTVSTLQSGDVVYYKLLLEGPVTVEGTVILTAGGVVGLEQIRDHIIKNSGFGPIRVTDSPLITGDLRYARKFTYDFYKVDGSAETRTGYAYGATILEDSVGESFGFEENGKLILKDMSEISIDVDAVQSFTISRIGEPTVQNINFTEVGYYGSTDYGGDLTDLKFAKLDLGEAADGWVFNGDVYFNNNGLTNRVTFSPNAVFRDDVFVYGTLYADDLLFNFANVHNLLVRNNLFVENLAQIKASLGLGEDSSADLTSLAATYPNLIFYVKGEGMMDALHLRDRSNVSGKLGTLYFRSSTESNAYAEIGGTIGDTDNPFGLKIRDERASATDEDRFDSFEIAAYDSNGKRDDVEFIINGDLKTTRYFIANYLGVGDITTPNTDYRLQVEGPAYVNDTLWVKALRFIGAESPEGDQDIIEPGNITVIGRDTTDDDRGESFENNEIQLREKKFTTNRRLYIDNEGQLGILFPTTGQAYYTSHIGPFMEGTVTEVTGARWAFDNVTYVQKYFDEIVAASTDTDTSPNVIVVDNIEVPRLRKYLCERIRVATLGSLYIEWNGYRWEGSGNLSNESLISSYYVESPYLRNRDGNVRINWFPNASREDNTFAVRVRGQIIDTNTTDPAIFEIDTTLALYIPITKWYQYGTPQPDARGYRSYAQFYPYENVVDSVNIRSFEKTSLETGFGDPGWKLAIYPRLRQQTRTSVGTNLDQLYIAQYDLDVIIVPELAGRVANMTGNLYISFVQS